MLLFDVVQDSLVYCKQFLLSNSLRPSPLLSPTAFVYLLSALSRTLQIVLSGFGTGEQQLKLTTIVFQNIFPAIDINTVSKVMILLKPTFA